MSKTPAAPDSGSEPTLATLRSQVDRLRRERDEYAQELEKVRERNHALEKRLDEAVDRLLELERLRARDRGAGDSTPLDPAVARERARASAELEVEASGPLRVAPAPHEDPGSEKPLVEIEGIPPDVVERLALVAVHTNLDLLRKAGPSRHRRALATSMRIAGHDLLRFVHRADLARIGLRCRDLQVLEDVGVDDLRALAGAEAAVLLDDLRSHGGATIDAATVDRWIHRARELTWMVDE